MLEVFRILILDDPYQQDIKIKETALMSDEELVCELGNLMDRPESQVVEDAGDNHNTYFTDNTLSPTARHILRKQLRLLRNNPKAHLFEA